MKLVGVPARVRASIPPRLRTLASPALEYAAAPLAGRSRRRFVIVCGQRTGSELLRELLDSLADVQCEGELLRKPLRWPMAYLNGRAALGGLRQGAWGCKVIDAHLREAQAAGTPPGAQLLDELVAHGWTIVNLRRADMLAQALSFLYALQGNWHFWGPSGFERFEADPAALIAVLYTLDANARWLDERLAQVPHTVVRYEGDLRVPEQQAATLARLADLLEVPYTGASSGLRPVAPARPEDRITNLPEVVRALEQTRFASLVWTPSDGA